MHIDSENKKIWKAIQGAKPCVPIASPDNQQHYFNQLFQKGNKTTIKQLLRQRQRMIKSKLETGLPSLSASRCVVNQSNNELKKQGHSLGNFISEKAVRV